MSEGGSHAEYLRVSRPPPDRPLMLFDGDCEFCRRWIRRWEELTQGAVDYAPCRQGRERYPEIPPAACDESVQLVEPDGRVRSGADAVFRALEYGPRPCPGLRLLRRSPWLLRVAETAYRFVARQRRTFSLMTRLFSGSRHG